MRVVEPGEGQPQEPQREPWELEVLEAIPAPAKRKTKGMPTKRTPERAVAVIKALRNGGTMESAAGYAGISRMTLWEWKRDVPALALLMEQAETFAEQSLVDDIRTAGRTTWQASAFLLERRWAKRWARRDKTDVTIETKRYAKQLADKYGLDEAEIIARAEELVAAAQSLPKD